MKRISIEFNGQSKGVVANVKIEQDECNSKELLKEVIELYEEAYKYADYKTKQMNGLVR